LEQNLNPNIPAKIIHLFMLLAFGFFAAAFHSNMAI
jgi:hypothetical protein